MSETLRNPAPAPRRPQKPSNARAAMLTQDTLAALGWAEKRGVWCWRIAALAGGAALAAAYLGDRDPAWYCFGVTVLASFLALAADRRLGQCEDALALCVEARGYHNDRAHQALDAAEEIIHGDD